MLLAFILVIMVLLHVEFFVRNILFGTDEANFFGFTIRYLFDQDVARLSLMFSLSCILAFASSYLIAHRLARIPRHWAYQPVSSRYPLPLWPLLTIGLLQVFASLSIAVQSGFVYQLIAERLEQAGFVLELRIIFLLLLSHLLLNVRLDEVMSSPRFRSARVITYLYVFALLLLQARSRIFEIAAVLAFSQLMWRGDRLRLKYFAMVGLALITPNIIVLGRLGWPEEFKTLVSGIFSFEYTVLLNNLLSAAIYAGPNVNVPFTFTPSLFMVLPSPIRSVLDIEIVKADYYEELAEAADVRNGGFSLLAELFTNFGWQAVWILGVIGALMGYINARALRVGRAGILISIAPLFYTAFILAFRNDLGVFIKYTVQLFVIASIINLLIAVATVQRPTRRLV